MTAAELQAVGAKAREDTLILQGTADQARLQGLITTADNQQALARADAAYTAAVQHAARTGDWAHVPAAHHALDQARSTTA